MSITHTENAVWPLPFNLDENVFKSLPELELYTLDSGLRVVLFPGKHSRSLKLEMYVNGGAVHQDIEKRGVPHFLEHLMFRSTKAFKDKEALTNFTQDFNLGYNGYTSDDNQGYFVISDLDDEATNAAAHFLSQVTLHPLLEKKYVEMEKQIIYAERESGESEPNVITWDTLGNHFQGDNHPLGGGGVIGETETILKYEHEDAVNFHNQYFTPANMLLVVSGGIEKPAMKKLVDKYFNVGKSSSWETNPLISATRETKQLETVNVRDFNHVNAQVGLYIPKPALDAYTLDFFATRILWHALSTRLFLDVREKQGLAYSVYATQHDWGHGRYLYAAGEFAKDKFKEGQKQLNKYMNEISDLQITKAEFKRAVRSIKSTRWADNAHSIAANAARKLFFRGSLVSPEYLHKWVDQLDLEYVNALPKRLFKDVPIETVIVGPVG